MPYSKKNYPDRIKMLPVHAQDIWVSAFNNAIKNNSEESSNKIAWSAVKKAGYTKNSKNQWIKASESYMYFNTINLSEGENIPNSVEIMRVGKWQHPVYGNFKITNETMKNIISNFDNKVRGTDISFDLEHGSTNHKSEAVCWVKKLRKEGSKLFAEVEWTDLGIEKIKSKSFKYFSPEFRFIYKDNETGSVFKDVLFGGGLTNRPFIKNMNPIMLSETIESNEYNSELYSPCKNVESEVNSMNEELMKLLKLSETATEAEMKTAVKTLLEGNVKLSEMESKVTELEGKISALNNEKSELTVKLNEAMGSKSNVEQENIKLNERVKNIESQLITTEWENIYNIALSEGKIVPAMAEVFKSQFMANPEQTKETIKNLPVLVKLNEQGTSQGKEEEKTNMALFEEKVNNIMLTEKLAYDEATIKVASQEPDLYLSVRNERRVGCN
jgi:phage I-like protein/cation transport regulator ChaB